MASLQTSSENIDAEALLPKVPEVLRTLVVEDSENDYLLIMAMLRRGGFAPEARRVETETGLREALEECDWDIVIADYRLPEFNAPAALAIVNHYCPDTPFIVVSGLMQEDLAAVTILSGAKDALHKEKLARLPAVIRRELQASRQRGEQRAARLEMAESREALKDSEARFLMLAQNLPECFWLYDVAQQKVVYANQAYATITGRPLEVFYHDPHDIVEAMHEGDAKRLSDAMLRMRFGGIDDEFRIKRHSGTPRWVHLRTFPVRDDQGVVRSVGGIMADISEMVAQQHELQRMAHFDALTGLPNRILFKERLSASLSMARRNEWQLALLFIDLDRFKVINDTLGHSVGDELLRLAAKRLRVVVRESDTVSRLGGDEFAIILPDLPSVDDAASVARKLVDALEQPFYLAGQDLFVSASIGITLFPDDTEDVDALIRNADAAMYRAKDAGRNTYEFYRAEMNQRAREMLALELDLRQALVRREFELHYQPKVSLTTGTMVGAEALIRWRSPQRGLVSPIDFIPLLEETGLIVPVGAWVLQEACRQAAAWHAGGQDHLTVAVNLSGRQLDDAALVSTVRDALTDSNLPARALELELTESMLMRDAPAVESLLEELRRMGLALSVDDFGTGYSSLAYLKRFPLDTLKVDRSFIRDITADPDDASITRAVIHMAHELSLKVVAEGVETADQLAMLSASGCDQIQGYYFSRPLPAAEFDALLLEHRVIDRALLLQGGEGHLQNKSANATLSANNTENLGSVNASPLPLSGLADMSHWLANALENTGVALLGVDQEGWIVFANEASECLFPMGAAIIGQMANEVLPASLMNDFSSGKSDVVGRWTPPQGIVNLVEQQWRVSVLPIQDGLKGETNNQQGWLMMLTPILNPAAPQIKERLFS